MKLRQLIREGRSLAVFDFDHTLAVADAWVYVHNDSGEIKRLDPAEFAVYQLQPNERFDFTDFGKMMRNPRLIKRNAKKLKDELEKATKSKSHKVTILTARSIGYPVRHFLKSVGLDTYVVALGSGNPESKAQWIEHHIQKGYTEIFFTDDSIKNLEAVRALKQKYPYVKLFVRKA